MGYPQYGITNRPPGHLLLAALSFTTSDPIAVRDAVERLRDIHEREVKSDLDKFDAANKGIPSAETGELGFDDGYDRAHLTVTVGFAKGAYEKMGVPPEQHPVDLAPIPWSQLGDNPAKPDNGDLVLQVCSDSVYVNEHVLRRVEEELGDRLAVAWTVSGAQRYTSRAGRTSREEGRALIGFLDGTSNLRPRRSDEDARLVFVDPASTADYPQNPPPQPTPTDPYGGGVSGPSFPADLRNPPQQEPEWTEKGTYMVARASTIDMGVWDKKPLGEQEALIGRFKVSGASLDLPDQREYLEQEPAFAQNPSNQTVALTSHVRKTNPRSGPDDLKRRVFRRGYPLVQATVDGLKRGLVFICFGRTISTQFEFMTRAWTANPNFPTPGAGVDQFRALEEVLCGGYYFVPPLEHRSRPWSWVVPDPRV